MSVADLYCGAGLYSAGFKEAGFNIVFGIDNDKNCCKTFKHNFPSAEVICEDILIYSDFPNVDIIIGSPPCIEFSVGNNDRNFDMSLVDRFLEIIKETKPDFWVMENVPDMGKTLNFSLNYAYKFPNIQVFTAYDFGAATIRKRFFGGKYPTTAPPMIHRNVEDVININRSGYRQPFKEHVYRKINPKKPLFTLCSQRIGNERYLLPNGTSLTVSEMAVCQGVPPWFVFPVSRSEMQRQLGNSVCPPVAKAIAESIQSSLSSVKK